MEFIKPKDLKEKKVDWMVSESTHSIVEAYAQYTGYPENEIVDLFLKNLLEDKDFEDWVQKKRNNKRLMQLFNIIEN